MTTHPAHEEDFDLYAVGALEGDEKLAIESHAAACPDCARKLAEALGRVAVLALAAPRVEPSAAVKERLVQQIRADASRAPSRPERRGVFSQWWAAALVPAAAVLVAATIFLWIENRQLDRQLAAMRSSMQHEQQQLQENREMAELVSASDTKVIALAHMPGMPKGDGRVVCSSKMGMLYYDGDLEPAPPNKSYQLWLIPAQGDPINAGVFNPAAGKSSSWMSKFPPGTAPKMFAVTIEPAGGMPHPTGPKVLVGAVS